jgi:hypothetical protein
MAEKVESLRSGVSSASLVKSLEERAAALQGVVNNEARINELMSANIGLSRIQASSIVNAENLLAQGERRGFQSGYGTVSEMARIGGGGGFSVSGLDYLRQQTDLQKRILDAVNTVKTLFPKPIEG